MRSTLKVRPNAVVSDDACHGSLCTRYRVCVFCSLKEAGHELQMELERLSQDNESLRAAASDCGRLQASITELETKLTDTQQKLQEQTSLVCLFSLSH